MKVKIITGCFLAVISISLLAGCASTKKMKTLEADNVISAVEVLNGKEPQGEQILMMGAGVIGCETAFDLARKGKKVTLCARMDLPELDINMVDHHNREMLVKMIEEEENITIMRGAIPIRLEDNGVVVEQNKEEIKIEMDSFVFAGRLFPINDLSESLKEETNVINIGDCVEAGTIMDAVWGGFNAVSALE